MLGVQIVGSSTHQPCKACDVDPERAVVVGREFVSNEKAELYEKNAEKSMLGILCMLVSATDTIIDLIFLLY